jgi:hypothetical protein
MGVLYLAELVKMRSVLLVARFAFQALHCNYCIANIALSPIVRLVAPLSLLDIETHEHPLYFLSTSPEFSCIPSELHSIVDKMPRNQHYVRDNFTVFDGADQPSPGLSKTIEMLARNHAQFLPNLSTTMSQALLTVPMIKSAYTLHCLSSVFLVHYIRPF